jgi:hypothetical protein
MRTISQKGVTMEIKGIKVTISLEGEKQDESVKSSPIDRGREWHLPTISQQGVEFITGSQYLQSIQREILGGLKASLWG